MPLRKRWLIIPLFFLGLSAYAQSGPDSVTRAAFIKSQTIKADSLNEAALKLAGPNASSQNLKQAINNIMSGLHIYSRFRDSSGLRQTFDNLGLVYHLQKKYTQAKWFILQSNTLSRDKNDTLNIISSLINLAAVKEDIKDFNLAKRDLDEALSLSKQQPKIDQQIEVQKAISAYFNKMGDGKNAAIALSRITFLKDSVAKSQVIVHEAEPAIVKENDSLTKTPVPLPSSEYDLLSSDDIITIISVVTVLLAGVGVVIYIKRKRRKNTIE